METPYKRVDIKLRGYIDTNTFEPCKPRVEEEWSWQELKTVKYLIHFDGSKFKKSRLAGVG